MNIAGVTPDEALKWLAVALGTLALIVGFVVWRGKRRGSRTIALDAALTVAGWWVALIAVGIVIEIIQLFTVTWTNLPNAEISMPWPGSTPCGSIDEPSFDSATLVCATPRTASISIEALDLGTRALITGGRVLGLILGATPGALIAVIAWNALRARPFVPIVSRALYIGAGVVVVVGIAAAVLSGLAENAALVAVLPDAGVTVPPIRFVVDPIVFGGAIGLAALGAVFQHGARLQRETEGLV